METAVSRQLAHLSFNKTLKFLLRILYFSTLNETENSTCSYDGLLTWIYRQPKEMCILNLISYRTRMAGRITVLGSFLRPRNLVCKRFSFREFYLASSIDQFNINKLIANEPNWWQLKTVYIKKSLFVISKKKHKRPDCCPEIFRGQSGRNHVAAAGLSVM